MGLSARIVKLLSFTRVASNHSGVPQSVVKVDQGGGDVVTAEHFASAGDDAFPCDQDYPVTVPLSRAGRSVVTGYADVVNQPSALKGDKRIYGRKSSDGTWVDEVWLKNDGTIFINNKVSSTTHAPDGTITTTNGAATTTHAPDGTVTTVNDKATWTAAPSGKISGVNPAGSYTLDADGSFKALNPLGSFGLAANGSITGGNGAGSFGLSAAGDFTVNGAKITAAGEVIDSAGIVLGAHTHSGVVPGGGSSGGPQ